MAIIKINNVEYRTTNELASILGVSAVTLWKWIKAKKIKAPNRYYRDRSWRLWTEEEIKQAQEYANSISQRSDMIIEE